MGNRYYSGVPSMSEQFTPVISQVVKGKLKNSKKAKGVHSVPSYFIVFLLSAPILPFWTAAMVIGETMKMMLTTRKGTPEREFFLGNIKFASVGFGIGVFIYMFLYNISGTFQFVFNTVTGLIF